MKGHADFETRSAVDIKKVGAWAYAMHPSTDILCLALARHGEEPVLFRPEHLREPRKWANLNAQLDVLVAHSAPFEYAIWEYILHRRYGWPRREDPAGWDCTLARSVTCGLPAALGYAAIALGVPELKSIEGRQALMKVCKPNGVDPLTGQPTFNESPDLLQTVYKYCLQDVRTEMALDTALPPLSPQEHKIWELDLVMNHRGVAVDVSLCKQGEAVGESLVKDLNAKLKILTGGKIESASRVAALKDYLNARGMAVETLDKGMVDYILASPKVPQDLKDVVSIRRQVGKTSTAKFTKAIEAAGIGQRVRGVLQYCAAHTGRWGGRLIQPQNYPQGLLEAAQTIAIWAVQQGAEVFSMLYGSKAMQTLSDILRGTIVAAAGKILVSADYSAIEVRVLFWLAGIPWPGSPYVDMAQTIYKDPAIGKKSHPKQYDVGKRTILGCGFGMGSVRFLANCAQYGVTVSVELAERAVKAYREKYRPVVTMWYATERAAINAVKTPGTHQQAMGGKVIFALSKDRRFLVCRLPSGRFLWYYKPSIKVIDGPRGEKEELHYWAAGINGALEQFKTYGGSLVENIVQAVARDIMANGMLKTTAAGFDLVLTVHDELLAEVDEEEEIDREIAGAPSILDDFIDAMCDLPEWAKGCIIEAEGWTGRRYRK